MATEDYFFHNWSVVSSLETRWETDISFSATSLAECRRQVLNRPQRFLSFRVEAMQKETKGSRMVMSLARLLNQNNKIPIYPDVSIISADSSGTTVNCPTPYRRFSAGKEIVILPWNEGEFGSPIVRTVSSFGASTITVTASLGVTVPAGSVVFPLLVAHRLLEESLEFVTTRTLAWTGQALEVLSSSIPSPTTAGATATGYSVHSDGLPIFHLEPEWRERVRVSLSKPGDVQRFGKDQAVAQVPAKALWAFTFTITALTRAEMFQVREFFDSRRGRLLPFWLPSPVPFWVPTAIGTTTLDLEVTFSDEDFNNSITHIAIVLKDGTIYIREVDTLTTPGDKRISWLSAIPATSLDEILYVGAAVKCRFSSDALREDWMNDEVGTTKIEMVEVLEDVSHTVDNIEYAPTLPACLLQVPCVIIDGRHFPYDPTGAIDGTGVDPNPNLAIRPNDACAYDHWHDTPGVGVDALEGGAAEVDADPGGCGYGTKIDTASGLFADLGMPDTANGLKEVNVYVTLADWETWKAAASGSKPAII